MNPIATPQRPDRSDQPARFMNRCLRLCLSLTALCSALAGGRATAAPICILPWDEAVAGRKLSIAWGETVREVGYLHPAARSEPISVPTGSDSLRLVTNDRRDAEGNPLTLPLRPADGIKKPLLILLPDPKADSGLRTLIIEDDQGDFGWGTFRLINVTAHPLAFRWDKKGQELKPGWKATDIEPGGKPRNMEVFLYDKKDLENPLYRAVWEYRPDMRQLVFVVPSQDASMGPYQFKFVPETRIEEEGGG